MTQEEVDELMKAGDLDGDGRLNYEGTITSKNLYYPTLKSIKL